MRSTRSPIGLIVLYLATSLAVLFLWRGVPRLGLSGDEPHYLAMASGISRYRTLELTAPYETEFRTRELYAPGLAPEGAVLSLQNAHAIHGPHGFYSIHGVGLPLLLAAPFAAFGVLGAQLFMIGLGGAVVLTAWNLSGLLSKAEGARCLAVAAVAIGMPLLPASSRVYPELVAGLICLTAFGWLLTIERRRFLRTELGYAAAIAFLPWLQIKFSAAAALLAIGAAVFIHRERSESRRSLVVVAPTVISLFAIGAFNAYAYGSVLGPYERDALQVSWTSVMVLIGLHLDQNQGFLMQNPVLWVGVFGMGRFFARYRSKSLLWLLVFASFLVPNAMHTNWYGGWSFSGRFQWAGAIVFMLPALFGLLLLAERRPGAFVGVALAGLSLQGWYFSQYAFSPATTNLFNRSPDVWRDFYSTFFGTRIASLLPEFYNESWAFRYGPNIAFTALAVGIVALSLGLPRRLSNREYVLVGGLAAALVLAGGLTGIIV